MAAGIYSITNTTNGHRYVGSAVNFARRWHNHRFELLRGVHHSIHLQRAWNKYGEAAFTFEVLEECELSRLIEREQWWIDAAQPEYNIARTAGSSLGIKRTEETCRRIGEGHKGLRPSDETRRKMSEAQKGRKGKRHTEETRRRIGEASKGRRATEETRLRLSKAGKGHPTSAETRRKISASHKGRIHTEEARQRMRDGRKGMQLTEEHRRSIGEGVRAYWEAKRAANVGTADANKETNQ